MSYTETEIKLHVKDLGKLATRLEALGATLTSPRTYETNLRFDTPAGTLSAQEQVLRLRQDAQSRLTYKGPTLSVDGVAQRNEIELTVSDFDATRLLIEALGYQQVASYEKYRTTYQLGDLHIMLDEMPYGDFIEIEGNDTHRILGLVERLSLNVGKAVKMSYLEIFRQLCDATELDASQLKFDAVQRGSLHAADVGIEPADS